MTEINLMWWDPLRWSMNDLIMKTLTEQKARIKAEQKKDQKIHKQTQKSQNLHPTMEYQWIPGMFSIKDGSSATSAPPLRCEWAYHEDWGNKQQDIDTLSINILKNNATTTLGSSLAGLLNNTKPHFLSPSRMTWMRKKLLEMINDKPPQLFDTFLLHSSLQGMMIEALFILMQSDFVHSLKKETLLWV